MASFTVNVKGASYTVNAPDEDTAWVWANQAHDEGMQVASKKSTQRTAGQAITDPLLSIGVGLGGLAQIPGQVATLTGATNVGSTMAKPGEAATDYFKSLQSEGLKARQALANKAMSDAEKEGVLSEFATAIKQTVTDPALLSTFVFEQLPMLLGPQAAATVTTKLGVKGIQTAATVEAKKLAEAALAKKATAAAVGTGAGMQGAGVGSDTYKEALKLLKEQYPDMPPEEREKIALNKGRVAALEAAAISVAAGQLPGASALEKRMAGLPGAGRVKTAAGETLNELLEEGGGKFASNVGLQEIDPTRLLTQGVGTAAGLGAIGGGTLGGILGKHTEPNTPGVTGAPGAPGQSLIDRTVAARAAEDAEAEAAAAAEAKDKTEAEAAAQAAAGTPVITKKGRKGKAAAVAPEATVEEEPGVASTILDEEKLVDIGVKKNKSAKTAFSVLNGADVSDPAQLPKILAVLRGQVKYHTEKGDTERVAKIQSFIDDITPTTEAPAVETPAAEVPTAPVAEIPALEFTQPVAPTIAEDQNVAAPVGESVGASASVVSEPIVPAAPEGVAEAQPVGVVPTEQDADAIAGREGQQPAALTEAPAPVPEVPTTERMSDDSNGVIKSVIERVGVYNSPSSSLSQRYNATDIIYAIATDKETPKAAKDFALRALKNAIDPSDMRPSLRGKYDETVKDVPEDDTPWGSYKNVVEVGTPEANAIAAATATPEFVTAVNAGKTRKAVQEIFNTSPDNSIIKLVAEKLLKASTLPKLSVAPSGVLRGKSAENIVGEYSAANDTARLDADVLTPSNLIHEVMHGFFASKIDMYLKGNLDAQIKRIDDLYQHLLKEYPQLKKQYGMTNLQEFVAEAMSNSEFQNLLKDIPYKKSNYFREFAKAVLRVLGITDKVPAWNAAAEALLSVEVAMDSGRALQESRAGYYVDTLPNYAQDAATIAQQGNMVGKAGERPGLVGKLTEVDVRVSVVDRYAKLTKILAEAYGGVRSLAGRINPESAIRQAVDANKVVASVMREGTLKFNADGIGEATELRMEDGTKVSAVAVIDEMKKYAKQEGVSYEAYDNTVSNVEYGHRIHNLYLRNDDIDSQIAVLRARPNQTPTTRKKIAELTSRKIPNPGMSRADAAVREAMFQGSAEYKRISAMKDAIRFSLIDRMVEAGRINADLAGTWKDATGYIPFDRLNDFEQRLMSTGGPAKGLAAMSTMKNFVGSDRKITSTMDSFMRFVDWSTTQALQNKAAYSAITDMELLGYATRGPKVRHDAPGKDNIYIYENGDKIQYDVPDMSIAVAFMGAPEGSVPSIIRGLQKSAQLLRAGVTIIPAFSVKQVAEDITRAMMQSGVKNPLMLIPRILYNFPKISVAEFAGKKLSSVRELEKLGVFGTYAMDTSDYVKNVQIEAGVLKRGMVDTFIHYGEILSKASDFAVREAIYKQTLAETKSATQPEGDKLLAEHRAREIINFSRKGTSKSIDYIARMAPFVNAQIQGMDKLLQAMAGNEAGTGLSPSKAKAVFWRRATVMTAASIGYAMMLSGDDEYEKQEDYIKFGSWFLPFGKDLAGVPMGIPVPKEIGLFFKVIPEAVVAYYKNQGTPEQRDALDLMGAVVRQFGTVALSVPAPTLLKALGEWATNYSFLMQRPLESASQQRLEAFERYGNQTSQVTKDMSKIMYHLGMGISPDVKIAISPIHIENMLRNLFGTTAGITLSVMDRLSNPNAPSRPLNKELWAQFFGASQFMQDEVGSRYIQDLYKLNDQASTVHNTMKDLEKKDSKMLGQYITENKANLAMYDTTSALIKDIHKLNDVAGYIQRDAKMTPDAKAVKMLELRKSAAKIASTVKKLKQAKREVNAQ